MTAGANPRTCESCGRIWRTYLEEPCDCTDDRPCLERQLFGADPHTNIIDIEDDFDEIETYRCPHGVMFDWLCRGCGAKVSGWGAGAAGFGELCGCEAK